MDDYLYFLLLIGWLAFSFYQQGAKKKKKLEQLKEAQEKERHRQEMMQTESQSYIPPAENVQPQAVSQPDFKTTLEEILLGGGLSLEDIPETEAQSLEDIPQPAFITTETTEENIFQKYYDDKIAERQNDNKEDLTKENEDDLQKTELGSMAEVHDEVTEELHTHFSLRNAIIYSEILNRRYAN